MKKSGCHSRMNRQLVCSLLFLCGCLLAVSAKAATDVTGSNDLGELQRYPNSWIVDYSQATVPEYRLATGKMKKINGVVSPQSAQYLSGHLTRVTYRLPSGRSSHEAFNHFAAQFETLGAQVLYRCEGRNCGDSDQWANYQFGIQRLYGIDREQYYQALSFEGGQGPLYLAFYTVKRGNKRVYVQLDLVDPTASQTSRQPQTEVADVLLEQLQQRQRAYLVSSEDAGFERLLTLLQQRQDLRLQLVGHSDQGLSAMQQRQHSIELALRLQQRLLDSGVEAGRVEVFGVGALAPAYLNDIPSQRIELLLLDSN
ncbi:DUF4892 domain-containing protein [Motiliproteus coralliicola]|uniref:DUF4892 domain-containing protein n=1 Tax=Motiliproteus coralliicola TaxID=2283196 RepID=A0A369WT36_9GAMM|nr:DUF4892 domain-containing protein [Motiliproteus coralliicola]RDE24229.1 DUF4892 domain-containing protein [Motiliproteus coralliicola]